MCCPGRRHYYGPLRLPLGRRPLPGVAGYRQARFPPPAAAGPRRVSPVPMTTFWPFHAPYAGGFLSAPSRRRDTVHGLRRRGTGSAPSGPPCGGAFDDACSGFARAADRSVDPPRFDARISPDAGGFTTRDPGVSLDRTLTGWLPSACRPVTSWRTSCHGARSAGRTPRQSPPQLGECCHHNDIHARSGRAP